MGEHATLLLVVLLLRWELIGLQAVVVPLPLARRPGFMLQLVRSGSHGVWLLVHEQGLPEVCDVP